MKKTLLLFIYCLPMIILSQTTDNEYNKNKEVNDAAVIDWLVDLNEKGVEVTKDSIILSKELQRTLVDEKYRTIVYPNTYTWEQTVLFIQNEELKKAFWYLINLYPINDKNKEMVIKSVVGYDKLFKMDEIMINTFYTYTFVDPEINIIKDGKPEIIRPDILEAKLRNVKEIVEYLKYYREQEAKNVKK
ncbi:MAG: hypothetical protein ACI93P_000892 [bacterium]|jgi:hypothetical protein